MEKPVKKSYEYQAYPKMVFHKTTGEHLICDCEDDIPEDYGNTEDVVLCDLPETEDTTADELKTAYDKGFADGLAAGAKKDKKPTADKKKPTADKKKADAKKGTKKPGKKGKAVTLKDLKLTREEAEEILKDDGVGFNKDTTDNILAFKIEKLLEDDKSE